VLVHIIFPHKIIGSFTDVTAVIHIDDASLDSTISLSFLHDCNVSCSIAIHHGVTVGFTARPVCVPSVDGRYNSQQTFQSVYLNGCDIELSHDWLAFVNAKSDGIQFLQPSDLDIAKLPDDHSWNLCPQDTYICIDNFHMVDDCF